MCFEIRFEIQKYKKEVGDISITY